MKIATVGIVALVLLIWAAWALRRPAPPTTPASVPGPLARETPPTSGPRAAAYPKEHASASIRGLVSSPIRAGKPRKEIDFGGHNDCAGTLNGTPLYRESEIVGGKGEVANVLVYIAAGLEGYYFKAPTEPVQLDQEACRFVPHVLGIQVDQTLLIRNRDMMAHNVNVQSEKNPGFNVLQLPGQENDAAFSVAELPIHIACNMHTWMNAHCAVFEHDKFTVTGEDGRFAIPGLAPGRYTLAIWHENLGEQRQTFELKDGESKTLDFVYRE